MACPCSLTKRERQIGELLVEHQKPSDIAAALVITSRTLYKHLYQMGQKLGLSTQRFSKVAKALVDNDCLSVQYCEHCGQPLPTKE